MTTWQYARLIIQPVPIQEGGAYNYWHALWLDPDGRIVELGRFDPRSHPLEPWRVNRWHLQVLNRTGSDRWELMHIQAYESDYHYLFKRPTL